MSTTVSDPMVGRLLDRRYRIEARLATGGMATVYTAHDTRLDRVVAVKVMHEHLARDETFVGRFIREAQSAARLSHPNAVAVYDQGDDEGTVYLAMEHVAGRTLRDVLREQNRLHPRDALEVLERVLSALAAAHRAGIVHRDVKPENVLISDEGRVKVADFGLARAVSAGSHTRTTGIIIGTVAYLAPEQVEHGTADARSDVYAAGTLLYEMLVGDVPFTGDTPLAVAYKHVHSDVPAPSARVVVPPALDDLVALATDRDPDRRPDDAAELLASVTACRRRLPNDDGLGQPEDDDHRQTLVIDDQAPPPATVDHRDTPVPLSAATRTKRRRRAVVVLVLVLLLAVAAGAGGWWYGVGRWTEAPKLTGMAAAEAKAKAARAGFTVDRELTYHETVAKGDVASTKPATGDRVLRGANITLVVSRGPERHEVPKLAGKSAKTAKAAVRARELTVGDVTRKYSRSVDKGTVISSDPKAGKLLRRDTEVDLVVSKGVPPVSVPKVVGDSEQAAENQLEDAGLKFDTKRKAHKTVPKGVVFTQSPDPGVDRAKGATVTIVVSTGPPVVDVPDVTGTPVKAAKKKLERAGFEVDARVIPGGSSKVIQQEPRGKARYGSTVKLWAF